MKIKERDKYWEELNGFKFKEEFLIYENLCRGLKWSKRRKLDKENDFFTYFEWKQYVIKKYCISRTYCKEEFLRYLNYYQRCRTIAEKMTGIYLMPFVVTIMAAVISNFLNFKGFEIPGAEPLYTIIVTVIIYLLLFVLMMLMFRSVTKSVYKLYKGNTLEYEFLKDFIVIIEDN